MKITVLNNQGNKVTIELRPCDTFEDFVKLYKLATQFEDDGQIVLKFFFSGKELTPDDPMALIHESDIIHCFPVMNVHEDFGATDNSYMESIITFEESELEGKIMKKGLNISGICRNKKCRKKNCEVICSISQRKFNFLSETEKIRCPVCDTLILLKSIYYYKCKFHLKGNFYDKEDGELRKKEITDNTNFGKIKMLVENERYDYVELESTVFEDENFDY